MGSLGNAPCDQKATQEPHSVQKSEAMNYGHIFHQHLYACCSNFVTPDRISAALWVLVWYSCGAYCTMSPTLLL